MRLTFLTTLLNIIDLVLPLLIAVAYFTLAERKIMAGIQRRKGPNVIGYLGLLQPLADGLKLFVKETVRGFVQARKSHRKSHRKVTTHI